MRRGRRGRAAGGGADSDEAGSDDLREMREGRQTGRAPRPRRSAFSAEQQGRLLELFEQHGHASKGYLDPIVAAFEGAFTAGQVRRGLKALGLKKGVPTERQVLNMHVF